MKLYFDKAKGSLVDKTELTRLKNEGIVDFSSIFCGIERLIVNDNEIRVMTSEALFPFDREKLSNYFDERLFNKNLLSVIVHAYTSSSAAPEYVIMQMRGSKTVQGKNKIQSAAAGFIDFGEHPRDAARREFIEEVNINDFYIEDEPIGIVNHYIGKNLNPCLVYIARADTSLVKEKIGVAKNLNEFNKLKERGDSEVAKLALIPYMRFEEFWNEVIKQNRQFGVKNDDVDLSIRQFTTYLNNAFK